MNRVATFASAFIRARKKLSAVRIGLVAVRAGSVGNRRLEVAGRVTREARHIGVFAEQREACF